MRKGPSTRASGFTESVIREMTRLCQQYGAVNLAQGFPDFDPPLSIKRAAARAIYAGQNQYSTPYGTTSLRKNIAQKVNTYNHIDCTPDDITVTCGTTEAMIASELALLDRGDEVVIFEPFYENYGPDAILSGAKCKYVRLREPEFRIEEESLKQAFNQKTKAVIINSPHNPTGRILSKQELGLISDLCQDYDSYAITDEIYEYILYDGHCHVSIGSLPGMEDRTITISGFSKTYSVTGWRVGYILAPKPLTSAIRKVHDFLTVCAPTPLQEACAVALKLPSSYYDRLRENYRKAREMLVESLANAGFGVFKPEGAYYIWTTTNKTGFKDDRKLALHLITKVGIGGVPGSSFFHNPSQGRLRFRFSFSKKQETIRRAIKRLERFSTERSKDQTSRGSTRRIPLAAGL
ncbi:MAG TPA: aminotransferase class I/II-fold pyridoxal phosphate-dependent enzyme [Candidatus Bathyarchaeia archaeon]|nr:aminotransferase class I/II-fold pyridoxal phosphate-dependent enzyme [Candidatus Bathyarchaeia archaeon]